MKNLTREQIIAKYPWKNADGWEQHESGAWIHDDANIADDLKIFNGVFLGGEFRGGEFLDGVFLDGVFLGGVFRGGVFRGGEFRGGVFRGGEFRGGVFRGGEFRGGEFLGGVFRNGVFLDGEFLGGVFLGGVFLGGEFRGGVFLDGEFRGGVFRGGEFRGGVFHHSPLFIQGSRHYVSHSGKHELEIGCQRHLVSYWLENFSEIGIKHSYSAAQIEEYMHYINLVAARDAVLFPEEATV
jgi:hypothetical protein